MKQFEDEVEENFVKFCKSCKDAASATANALSGRREKYLESYRRLVSLQAWRVELLERVLSPDSLAFFLEAQNDALTSHVLARAGVWRSALKALRSCIENVMFSMYYKDHPVELQLWHDGSHKLNYSELAAYFAAHPAFVGVPPQRSGLDRLTAEFSTLSRAVHGSAKSFRMSIEGIGVQLWSDEAAKLGAWATREQQVLTGVNRLLMTLYRDQLQGAQHPSVRKAISLVVPDDKQAEVKRDFGITLFKRTR